MYLWQDHGLFGVFDLADGWCRVDADGHEPGGVHGVVCDVIPDGEDMVAWLAVGFIVVLLTGFYLWYWPGVRRWATAFVIRRGRGRFAFHMSVHKVVGLVVWMPLLVIAFTGAAFAFPAMKGWLQDVTPAEHGMELWSRPDDALTSGAADGRSPITPGAALSVLEERYPDRTVRSIAPPVRGRRHVVGVGLSRGLRSRGPRGRRRQHVGARRPVLRRGRVRRVARGRQRLDQAWDDWSFPVAHGRLPRHRHPRLWAFVGLSPLVLGATGITMNLVRRSKPANTAARVRRRRRTDLPPTVTVEEPDRRGGTVAGLNETLLRELFATPPPDFVAARNEVVKALRKDKARDDATAVAALRRPGWDEWALNAVATSDPAVVAGFIEAAAQVRDAQAAAIEGREGPDIRSALRDLRDRSADLVRLADGALAGAGRQAAAGEINARLSKVAASDVAPPSWSPGSSVPAMPAPNELFADLQPGRRPARKPTTATKPRSRRR